MRSLHKAISNNRERVLEITELPKEIIGAKEIRHNNNKYIKYKA